MYYNESVKKTMLLSNYKEIIKNVPINRLYREVSLFYFKNVHDRITNIMNRECFIKYIDNSEKYSIEIGRSILFYFFKLQGLKNKKFILQINRGHPFYVVNSYFYKEYSSYKEIIYECIKRYLNGSHEDVIKHIVSYLPNNEIMSAKEYYFKRREFHKAFNIAKIEDKRNWAPTYEYSGIHVLTNKYKKIVNDDFY